MVGVFFPKVHGYWTAVRSSCRSRCRQLCPDHGESQTEKHWPDLQEGIIGSSFLIAASTGILLLCSDSHSGEQIQEIVSGQILWIDYNHSLYSPIEGVDLALQLAATMDTKYLNPIAHYYSIANMLINRSTAKLFIQNLPSESIDYNYTIGGISSPKEFNQYNSDKAVKYIEYDELRDTLNAAADLSNLYTEASYHIKPSPGPNRRTKKIIDRNVQSLLSISICSAMNNGGMPI